MKMQDRTERTGKVNFRIVYPIIAGNRFIVVDQKNNKIFSSHQDLKNGVNLNFLNHLKVTSINQVACDTVAFLVVHTYINSRSRKRMARLEKWQSKSATKN